MWAIYSLEISLVTVVEDMNHAWSNQWIMSTLARKIRNQKYIELNVSVKLINLPYLEREHWFNFLVELTIALGIGTLLSVHINGIHKGVTTLWLHPDKLKWKTSQTHQHLHFLIETSKGRKKKALTCIHNYHQYGTFIFCLYVDYIHGLLIRFYRITSRLHTRLDWFWKKNN